MNPALFVGWRPDADGRRRLAALVDGLVEARPADAPTFRLRRPDQWHATLCYIGQPGGSRAAPPHPPLQPIATTDLQRHLAEVAVAMPPCTFTPGCLAYWPGPGVIVALPREDDALLDLCGAVRDAIVASGIVPKSPTTRPHLTLARLDRNLPGLDWLGDVDCGMEAMPVDGFELLYNAGGRYEALGGFFRR